ncbi:hypothetical protein B296_00030491 [Ensete ventricosum]|uniref:Uncharacterized protein n=1 Tax=Ensete ventricosum TaxID=4639 RepID=A0A426YJ52_ENSVE|nr:hypothetical protein B296_00030491 [Ensete ventricosum]
MIGLGKGRESTICRRKSVWLGRPGHDAIRLDAVLEAVELPAGVPHLDPGLADVDADDLPHLSSSSSRPEAVEDVDRRNGRRGGRVGFLTAPVWAQGTANSGQRTDLFKGEGARRGRVRWKTSRWAPTARARAR